MLLVSILISAMLNEVWAANPFVMTWSSTNYGPDGPWQAIQVGIGSQAEPVSLYPGGRWSSYILTRKTCANTSISTTCYGETGRLFTEMSSTSFKNVTDETWGTLNIGSADGYAGQTIGYDSINIGAGVTVPNVSLSALDQTYETFPNGVNYENQVGILSLGAPLPTHTWGNSVMMLIPSWMSSSGGSRATPSNSYGLHVGSASLGIPGSLVLGGFDQNRVLGEVSSQSFVPHGPTPGGATPIGLLDIGLGVATGGSPWPYQNKTGLLSQGNSSIVAPVTVEVDPVRPYLYLPRSTCDAIAADLPVTFNDSLGLYFWDTTNTTYKDVVTSPAFLRFTFQKNSQNTDNFTINVPFPLLNLTLKAPLVDGNTSYFPCFPTTKTPTLGRAFLQAAFIGVNWGKATGTGSWFLAQAPGPGLVTNPTVVSINPTDATINASQTTWEDSWNNHWTPLPVPVTSASDGLTTGAKAGIGVGVAVGGLLVITTIAVVILRRRLRKNNGGAVDGHADASGKPKEPFETPGHAIAMELDAQQQLTRQRYEMEG